MIAKRRPSYEILLNINLLKWYTYMVVVKTQIYVEIYYFTEFNEQILF